jgi:Flp pilus assembly protein TadG
MIKKMIARKTSERGQSFMELAVSMIFLLVLLTVVIDLAWAFYTMIALRDAAQEAASYGSMCPNKDLIAERLRLSATTPISMEDIPDDEEHIKIEFLDADTRAELTNGGRGNLVRVTAQVDHDIIVPFAASFLGRTSYPLRVNVADTVMRDTCPN